MIEIKRGLDLPIAGAPARQIESGSHVEHVAVMGVDYIGMKPTMSVREGDHVARGQTLFTDKKTEGVRYCAPATGEVVAINRGERRRLLSVVIRVDETGSPEPIAFEPVDDSALENMAREQIVDWLNQTGLWVSLRTRPFSRVPALDAEPADIFVTAMDTHPLAGDPALVIAERREAFVKGLAVLRRLTRGRVYVCHAPDADIPGSELERVQHESFRGPHPAGLVGTHIHYLSPVGLARQVWHIGYQDVIAIGLLFGEGRLNSERVIAIGGPRARQPRLVRTLLGASLDELLKGEIEQPDDTRVISGSVFGGTTARGALAYLGRFHDQVSLVEEGDKHAFMGWLSPGRKRHSVLGIYLSRFIKPAEYRPNTNTNGSERAMVPVGSYETVMPLDILPTQLLRSLIVGDIESAMALGCLELDEEDLALCTYVCPGKYEYGPILRENLMTIEKEV
ncbi:Na(+)-translocating NADH-quinone reductase subunit A [Kushneria phosphatilytica]|uniref:Na(+)-translocating NADH-quinone reductase subunit A n=1 Tax=Kushneria phosphatilytica TaxID=657387 RepID=A0A1S1P2R3_9GAMM|nr:Na(+)-translocating NADH-quinone reductase subunit A [Kushneria phosphatilytica]OHV13070.1 NADH:ubiquinone reductase (Na(+)-transporting) subunit A [Kushneria phosphatilytica]QEL10941.1 Na(+)-translocating NADH-quinone reductase subunit A [Kushneria phosphatilytica]